MYLALHHVQLAMPAGEEPAARAFYGGVLGLSEVPKPPALAARGGTWFRSDPPGVELHLGVENGFQPARKAHPALLLDDLEAVVSGLARAGVHVTPADAELPGYSRCYVDDPFGNRLELLARTGGPGRPQAVGSPSPR